jgi:GGDEF domain-containing protein
VGRAVDAHRSEQVVHLDALERLDHVLHFHGLRLVEAGEQQPLDQALETANAKPNRVYPLGFSVGILACGPTNDSPMETLLSEADALMYEEKRKKRGE